MVRPAGGAFDTSEQVTWLNDAVLMAPSMLLTPAVRWLDGPDDNSFVLDFTDAGRIVRAEVLLDAAELHGTSAPTTGMRTCQAGWCGPDGAHPSRDG